MKANWPGAAIILAIIFMFGVRHSHGEEAKPGPWRIVIVESVEPTLGTRVPVVMLSPEKLSFATEAECRGDHGLKDPKMKASLYKLQKGIEQDLKMKVVTDTDCIDSSKFKKPDAKPALKPGEEEI